MALIKCPECGKEISDQAPACIHCGFPLKGVIAINSDQSKIPQKDDFGFIWVYIEKAIIKAYKTLPYRKFVASVFPNKARTFADVYVLCVTIVSIVFANIVLHVSLPFFLEFVLSMWLVYRVSELFIYWIHEFFIIGYRRNENRNDRVASSRRMLFILLSFNTVEIINFFIIAGVFVCNFKHILYFTTSYADSFLANFYCFLTFSPEYITDRLPSLSLIAFFEVIFGFVFLLTVVSRVLNSFKPHNSLEDEQFN